MAAHTTPSSTSLLLKEGALSAAGAAAFYLTARYNSEAASWIPSVLDPTMLPWLVIATIPVAWAALKLTDKAANRLEDKLDDDEELPEALRGTVKGVGSSLPEAGISAFMASQGLGAFGFLNAVFSNFVNPSYNFHKNIQDWRKTGKWKAMKATNKQQLLETAFAGLAIASTVAFGLTVGWGGYYALASVGLLAGYALATWALGKTKKQTPEEIEAAKVEETRRAALSPEQREAEDKAQKNKTNHARIGMGASMAAVVGAAALAGFAIVFGVSGAGLGMEFAAEALSGGQFGFLALGLAAVAPWIARSVPVLSAVVSSLPEFKFTDKGYQGSNDNEAEMSELREEYADTPADQRPDSYYEKMYALQNAADKKRSEGLQNNMSSAFVNFTLVSGAAAAVYQGHMDVFSVAQAVGVSESLALIGGGAMLIPIAALMTSVAIHAAADWGKRRKYGSEKATFIAKERKLAL